MNWLIGPFLAWFAVFFPISALACAGGSFHLSYPPHKPITNAKTIVLAKAIEPNLVDLSVTSFHDFETCQMWFCKTASTSSPAFQTIEVLKGNAPDLFRLPIGTMHRSSGESGGVDFNGHTDELFWIHGAGRAVNDSACIISTSFTAGQTYLIFIDYVSMKSYELILSEEDQWLQYVRGRVAREKAFQAYAETPQHLIDSFYRRLSSLTALYLARWEDCLDGKLRIERTLNGLPQEDLSIQTVPYQFCREVDPENEGSLFLLGTPALAPKNLLWGNVMMHRVHENGDIDLSRLPYADDISWNTSNGTVQHASDLDLNATLQSVESYFLALRAGPPHSTKEKPRP